MNEELIKAVKLALTKKGLNEGLVKFITVENDGEIDGAINEFMTLAPPKTPALTSAQMLELPEVKSEVDRRITASNLANTQNLAKKYGFDPTKEGKKTDDNPDEVPAWVQKMIDSNKALEEKVSAFEAGKTIEIKKQDAFKKLESSTIIPKGVQEKWSNRIDVNSETSIEDQIAALETEYTETAQMIADSAGYAPKPGGGDTKQAPSETEVANMMGNVLG